MHHITYVFFFFGFKLVANINLQCLESFLASWFQYPLALTHTKYTTWALFLSSYTSAWSGFHTALSKSNLEYHPSAPPSLLNTPACTYISLCARALTAWRQRALLFQSSVHLLRKGPCIALPLWLIDSLSLVKCYWLNYARSIVQLLQSCTKPFDPSPPPHHFHLSFNYK